MRLFLILTLLLSALPAWADRPPTGILANRSGLPASIPFQFVTPPGRDHAVMMIDPATTRVRMAAYVRGGETLRLLMPPGDYLLHIASGPAEGWQDEAGLFGPETRWAGLDRPLRFEIVQNRRLGHRLTMTDRKGDLVLTDHRHKVICQTADWNRRTTEVPFPGQPGPGLLRIDRNLTVRKRFCD